MLLNEINFLLFVGEMLSDLLCAGLPHVQVYECLSAPPFKNPVLFAYFEPPSALDVTSFLQVLV